MRGAGGRSPADDEPDALPVLELRSGAAREPAALRGGVPHGRGVGSSTDRRGASARASARRLAEDAPQRRRSHGTGEVLRGRPCRACARCARSRAGTPASRGSRRRRGRAAVVNVKSRSTRPATKPSTAHLIVRGPRAGTAWSRRPAGPDRGRSRQVRLDLLEDPLLFLGKRHRPIFARRHGAQRRARGRHAADRALGRGTPPAAADRYARRRSGAPPARPAAPGFAPGRGRRHGRGASRNALLGSAYCASGLA